MELITDKGELTLPKDFSFSVQQNSAFFSDAGVATVATTIPATSADQEKLGYPVRVGKSTRFINSFPAVIRQGIFQKKGTLVVDSASPKGICCSIALEDSDFYSQFKTKTLKEIFSNKVLTDFSTVPDWYDWVMKIYRGEIVNDLAVFPVAVNKDSEGHYQMNNEPVMTEGAAVWPLAYKARIGREGDEDVSLPEGYGIAPFMKLWAFLETLFTLCGYTVKKNCFAEHPLLSTLVLVHNCPDAICRGRINYADLVPSCSVSDLLKWLRDKFMSQIVVDATRKTVDIILFSDILRSPADMNLSDKEIGVTEYTYSPSKRLTINSDTSLEGASPAAMTVADLLAKYGSVRPETATDRADSPCLALDLATGQFYEVHKSLAQRDRIDRKSVSVGSNCIPYDRRNSEETENLSSADVFPVMVWNKEMLMPYIGDRIHLNTSCGDESPADQKIIVVDYAGLSRKIEYSGTGRAGRLPVDNCGGHYNYATTQKYDNGGKLREGRISLVPEEMYFEFFAEYNNILLNNSIHASGRFDLTPGEICQYRLYSLKMLDGQKLLPVSMVYEVGHHVRCRNATFLLAKTYSDSVSDLPVIYPAPLFKWVFDDSQIDAKRKELEKEWFKPNNGNQFITYDYDDAYGRGEKDVFLMPPSREGELSARLKRNVAFTFHFGRSGSQPIGTFELEEWFYSVKI